MADVFVSYAAKDGDIARYVAQGLKHADYDVWEYQADGQTPGADYLDNIGEGVRQARVVVLFVSTHSIASPQCNSEAQIAWEESKEVIPLLRGVTFDQLRADRKGKRWADRIGTKVSIQIDGREPQQVLEAVLAGLQATLRTTGGAPRLAATPLAAAPVFTGRSPSLAPSSAPASGAPPAGAVVAGVVGGLGLLYCLYSFGRVQSPATPQEAWMMANFPTVKTANILVNLAGLAQNAALLYGAWLVHRGDPRGAPWIRKVALSMLAVVGLWLIVCLFSLSAGAARIPNPADRSAVIGGTFFLAMLALVPSGIVFWLFRGARR